ncbi:hypothetical protein GQ53DRAFT_610462, partial [Thozetella sp. PMI_491]
DKYEEKAKQLSQKSIDEQERQLKEARQNQTQRPWLRQDADKPPADDSGKESQPMPKGKLLTTPSRLLKLIVPLPIHPDKNKQNKGQEHARAISNDDEIQPLALLVHPQQPLSYLERLIQAELPPVVEDGKEKIPNIYFRAEDTGDSGDAMPHRSSGSKDGKGDRGASRRTHVASYSGLGHEGPERDHADKKWVRWSSSTEIGDFIRDAARGREFAIEIEGYGVETPVSVPSFKDRTHYMRVRLRKMSRQIDQLAKIKQECDLLAHRGAHRLAKGGFGLLAGWWGVVYYTTFWTEQGWDLVEPITYLAGLTTIMGGYLWFLYISRDLSYKAALNLTVSRRQNALYEERGLDLRMWEQLVQEANTLRTEIKKVAAEYDVEWDETKDVSEEVKEVLDKEKRKKEGKSDDGEEDEDVPEEPKDEK